MVNRCASPSCQEEFKCFTAGELYALDRRSADTEFFWLCPVCASHFVVFLEPAGRVGVKPKADFRSPQRSDSERCLRLVTPRSVGTPRLEAGRPRRMTLSAERGTELLCHTREVP
jgi:hypothetical protein